MRIYSIRNWFSFISQATMYVCICHAVTDKQIRHAVRGGCERMRELREELGVASSCGKCAPAAQQLLRDEQTSAMGSRCQSSFQLIPV